MDPVQCTLFTSMETQISQTFRHPELVYTVTVMDWCLQVSPIQRQILLQQVTTLACKLGGGGQNSTYFL